MDCYNPHCEALRLRSKGEEHDQSADDVVGAPQLVLLLVLLLLLLLVLLLVLLLLVLTSPRIDQEPGQGLRERARGSGGLGQVLVVVVVLVVVLVVVVLVVVLLVVVLLVVLLVLVVLLSVLKLARTGASAQ